MSVHGTARFATRDELRMAGLLRSRPAGTFPEGLMVGWWFADLHDFEPIEYQGDLHQLIVGGTGGGKFTTAIAPMLLGSSLADHTVVLVDPKGEIANLAGPWFQQPFAGEPNVHLLDPWDQCGTGRSASLNVLDQITPDNPNYVDDARALADAMIIPSGGENTHWDNAARNFLTSMLLYVALSPNEKDNRDLLRVRELVSMTWALPKTYTGPKRPTLTAILYGLLDSDLGGGAVRRGITSILNREDKERSGIISSIDRDTSWIDSPQMEKVLRGKSLDLRQAARGGHKYFIVLPPDFFMTHRAWLRLMVTAFAKAFKRTRPEGGNPQNPQWRHIVIDEFANLGEMSFIQNDIAVSRGFDVKYHLAIQDLSQLARVYDKGWESFINNSFQRFFAISDLFTAEYVSRMLGAATAQSISNSRGTSGSQSLSQSASDSISRGTSSNMTGPGGTNSSGTSQSVSVSSSETSGWSSGQSVNPVQRPLRTPDEVRRLSQQAEYLFFRGMHPVECWRPNYWEVFPSLPKFKLKEVLGTIGRKPKDSAEQRYFTGWRDQSLLAIPQARPAPEALPPPPPSRPAPVWEPKPPLDYRIKIALGIGALLILVLIFRPSIPFFRSPPPPPVTHTVIELPVRTATAERPSPPAPPVKTRPPVPDLNAASAMPAGAATRDYLISLMRQNANRCAPGHGAQELKMMNHLAHWAMSRGEDTPAQGFRTTSAERYMVVFRQYLSKASWTRAEREEVFELILRTIHENYSLRQGTAPSLERLYANGGCPFDTVAEADYLPPVLADTRTNSIQR
jgi:type IV secretory pathway TraG/TraD family ATPase VirD4